MKKTFLTVLLIAASANIVGCSRNAAMTMPNQPGVAAPTTGDPYGTGTGYGTTPTVGDPYGTGAGYGAPATGYPTTTPNYNDPYGTGMGTGYPQTGTGYPQTGTGYPQTGMPGQTGYGQPVIDPMTGQPMIDPMTGQPMMNNGISQQIVSKIQSAGGYRGGKADSAVTDSLKGTSVQMAFGSAPLEHRSLAIKALLDGWCTAEEKNYAQQIWNTILPQDQQRVMGQDAELSKLVTSKLLQGKSNGFGSVLTEIGKMVGLGG